MPNRLERLTLFKHRLNGLNTKQRVTDCLPFTSRSICAKYHTEKLNTWYHLIPHIQIVIQIFFILVLWTRYKEALIWKKWPED